MINYGTVWYGKERFSTAWHCAVYNSSVHMACNDIVRQEWDGMGIVGCAMVCDGIRWDGMGSCCHAMYCDIIWYDMVFYVIVWSRVEWCDKVFIVGVGLGSKFV